TLPNFGSGRISRFGTSRRRGISCFLVTVQLDRFHGHGTPSGCATYMRCAHAQRCTELAGMAEWGSGLLGTLGTVLGTGLLTVLDALQVEGTANDVVTHTGQVLHTAAANEDDRVLLQVVAFTADVRNDFV